jgi:hypothetical protein
MKPIGARVTVATLAGWMVLTVGCAGPARVANPDYQGWASFQPGSSITFEGHQSVDGQRKRLRITEKLLSKDKSRVVLERAYEFLEDDVRQPPVVETAIEPARIHPGDHPVTHPHARIEHVPDEELGVAGRTVLCRVMRVEVAADARGWWDRMEAAVYLNESVPGGVARVLLRSETPDEHFELAADAVDFDVTDN